MTTYSGLSVALKCTGNTYIWKLLSVSGGLHAPAALPQGNEPSGTNQGAPDVDGLKKNMSQPDTELKFVGFRPVTWPLTVRTAVTGLTALTGTRKIVCGHVDWNQMARVGSTDDGV
jgi:hypothetical protein